MNTTKLYQMSSEINANAALIYTFVLEQEDKTIRMSSIANAIGIARPTVIKNLNKLKDFGYIDWVNTYDEFGGLTANAYTILK